MSNRSKSLFRGPNVKHFALVHRSVRDPLANDPESSDRVLSEVQKGKGRTRADLESLLGSEDLANVRKNEGEAALYGVYYDDSGYDYMQHLRGVGEGGDAEVSQLVETARANDVKGKGKARMELRDEAQEATYRDYLEQTVEEEGLRPDMDPSLREVLEALDDDAYVEDDDDGEGEEGDFFDDLIKGRVPKDYREPAAVPPALQGIDPSSTYATQVARFKTSGAGDSDDEFEEGSEADDLASEGGDTIAELRAASARRPPRKTGLDRKSLASASAFSMSSSSMFRNDGLSTLDDRFDQIEAMYEEESESDDEEPDEMPSALDDIMDDFLTNYEIHGGKLSEVVGGAGATSDTQLDMVRSGVSKMQILEIAKRQAREDMRKRGRDDTDQVWSETREDKANRWDCETILSTYSNLENHPRVIRANDALRNGKKDRIASDTRISIDPKTGFPVVLKAGEDKPRKYQKQIVEEEEDNGGDSDATMGAEEINEATRQTITRSRNETPEEKKARKAAVKEERAGRRAEKRSTKETFGQERKRQQKVKQNKLSQAADVGKGNVRGIEVMRLS